MLFTCTCDVCSLEVGMHQVNISFVPNFTFQGRRCGKLNAKGVRRLERVDIFKAFILIDVIRFIFTARTRTLHEIYQPVSTREIKNLNANEVQEPQHNLNENRMKLQMFGETTRSPGTTTGTTKSCKYLRGFKGQNVVQVLVARCITRFAMCAFSGPIFF